MQKRSGKEVGPLSLEERSIRRAYLASRQEDKFPAPIVDHLLSGESPLRVFREWRGLAQQGLATASGVSIEKIGEIESRIRAITVDEARAVADALNMDVDEIE